MTWVHDTGYGPAYAHEGRVVAVHGDGSETDARPGDASHTPVVGWRAACSCGHRGRGFHPGTGAAGPPPWRVEGRCRAEWERHLFDAVPELGVHDRARVVEQARADLAEAVRRARAAGASWATVGRAAGVSRQSAHERWGDERRGDGPGVTRPGGRR